MAIKRKAQVTKTIIGKDRDGKEQRVNKDSGVSQEHTEKHFNTPCIGMNKGVTVNMGDFQSLRVDVWVSLPLSQNPTEDEIYEKYHEIEEVIDDILDTEIDKETNN